MSTKRLKKCFYLFIAALAVIVHGLTIPESPPVAFRIVGNSRTGTQYLPTSYALNFARWEIDRDSKLVRLEDQPVLNLSSRYTQIRPTIDFVVRGGVPAYFMAGLQTSISVENIVRPYSSVIAQQWLTFDMSIEPNMRLLIFRGEGDGSDERVALFGPETVNNALERLAVTLSEENEQLKQGFHILSIPIDNEWITLTEAEECISDALVSVSCMATAEPEPRELLSLDDSLLEMTATSLLKATNL